MIAHKETFRNIKIVLDGATFTNCTFEQCTFIFSGLLPFHLDNCQFDNCAWEVSGPAHNTLQFMALLYAGGAQDLIQSTFDKIKAGYFGVAPGGKPTALN
ncbi:hypothetical protein QRQ56_30870 [Bradyrhizobium sp. U531]|uniref:hypothetical protein n=1 Tax=Bradyrhizobium sp. U531 TaxID=3053458 RepID=UPI003F42F7F8